MKRLFKHLEGAEDINEDDFVYEDNSYKKEQPQNFNYRFYIFIFAVIVTILILIISIFIL